MKKIILYIILQVIIHIIFILSNIYHNSFLYDYKYIFIHFIDTIGWILLIFILLDIKKFILKLVLERIDNNDNSN